MYHQIQLTAIAVSCISLVSASGEFSTELTSGGAALMATVLNSSVVDQLQNHGCWCAKFDRLNSYAGGSHTVDELDHLCKQWFTCRRCNRMIGGTCRARSTEEYTVSSAITVDESCADNVDSCLTDTCVIDSSFVKDIVHHLSGASTHTWVNGDTELCKKSDQSGSAGNAGTEANKDGKHQVCTGSAPDLTLVNVKSYTQEIALILDGYSCSETGIYSTDAVQYGVDQTAALFTDGVHRVEVLNVACGSLNVSLRVVADYSTDPECRFDTCLGATDMNSWLTSVAQTIVPFYAGLITKMVSKQRGAVVDGDEVIDVLAETLDSDESKELKQYVGTGNWTVERPEDITQTLCIKITPIDCNDITVTESWLNMAAKHVITNDLKGSKVEELKLSAASECDDEDGILLRYQSVTSGTRLELALTEDQLSQLCYNIIVGSGSVLNADQYQGSFEYTISNPHDKYHEMADNDWATGEPIVFHTDLVEGNSGMPSYSFTQDVQITVQDPACSIRLAIAMNMAYHQSLDMNPCDTKHNCSITEIALNGANCDLNIGRTSVNFTLTTYEKMIEAADKELIGGLSWKILADSFVEFFNTGYSGMYDLSAKAKQIVMSSNDGIVAQPPVADVWVVTEHWTTAY